MDWVTTIRNEAQRNSILRTDGLAHKYKIVPVAVTQALSRQEQRGLGRVHTTAFICDIVSRWRSRKLNTVALRSVCRASAAM